MSTTVWPFTLLRPYNERRVTETTRVALANGFESARSEFGAGKWRMYVDASLRLPYGGKTLADWISFITALDGSRDTFLFKCLYAANRTQTAEALGSGDGSTTAFALDMRYVDATTLQVFKAGVLQALTTHYTFSGNNTAPVVTFVSAPSGGQAVTATYDYYTPMRFAEGGDDPSIELLHDTGADATRIVRPVKLELVEEFPNARRVAP